MQPDLSFAPPGRLLGENSPSAGTHQHPVHTQSAECRAPACSGADVGEAVAANGSFLVLLQTLSVFLRQAALNLPHSFRFLRLCCHPRDLCEEGGPCGAPGSAPQVPRGTGSQPGRQPGPPGELRKALTTGGTPIGSNVRGLAIRVSRSFREVPTCSRGQKPGL